MTYDIIDLGNGWYNFKNIPQGYIKIHGLLVGSEKKAIDKAKKMLINHEPREIRIVKA